MDRGRKGYVHWCQEEGAHAGKSRVRRQVYKHEKGAGTQEGKKVGDEHREEYIARAVVVGGDLDGVRQHL
eukprot:scaffold162162_cov33-Tisochrysis_lutea.AAC.2